MTVSLESMIAAIPPMEPADFDALARAVLQRINDPMTPLTEAQWAEKLDHSIAQAERGGRRDAAEVIERIRSKYHREKVG